MKKRRLFSRVSQKAGMPPGAMVHVGQSRVGPAKYSLIAYDHDDFFEEHEIQPVSSWSAAVSLGPEQVTWLNIDGLHEVEFIAALGDRMKLHPLILEDILHTEQRPKLEEFEDYLFIVLKMLYWNDQEQEVNGEQLSLILGDHYVCTLQEVERDVFGPVRSRLREEKARVRRQGADYLAYTLLDAVVDNYFIVLENLGERIEFLEEEVIIAPTPRTLQEIHKLKRELIYLRKSVWPLREVVSSLERIETDLIQAPTRVYLRDIYDHTIQVMDIVETFRDTVSGTLDIYLSSLSNQMNEVMKVLTIIATLFIPLTFIVGLYGMNFRYMPELEWRWGYFGVLGVMGVIVIAMVLYFRRKNWF
jgi:magnesium transporter